MLKTELHSRQAGFTLIEMMIVIGIVGILAAMAAPGLVRMSDREEARQNAQLVGNILKKARGLALDNGRTTMVVFFPNGMVGSTPTAFASIIIDENQDDVYTFGLDTILNFDAAGGTGPTITTVTGLPLDQTSPPSAPLATLGAINFPREDNSAIATGPAATLANVPNNNGGGNTFPLIQNSPSVPINARGIRFDARGIPSAIDPVIPPAPGTGAGAFYITDNNSAIYTALLLPLGGVRVRAYEPAGGTWQ